MRTGLGSRSVLVLVEVKVGAWHLALAVVWSLALAALAAR